MEERVIRVKGKGRVSVPPDCIQLSLSLNVLNRDYAEAMRLAGQYLEDIRQALKGEGLHREHIRTTNFSVSTSYERKQDRYLNSQEVFVGYRIANELKIEIEQDSRRLGRILNALALCRADPEISIRYALRDEAAMKDELLRRAVQDAHAKASVLAESAGLALGEIRSVDYSWGEIEVRRAMYTMSSAMVAERMVDLEPEALQATDTVTVVWAIK